MYLQSKVLNRMSIQNIFIFFISNFDFHNKNFRIIHMIYNTTNINSLVDY